MSIVKKKKLENMLSAAFDGPEFRKALDVVESSSANNNDDDITRNNNNSTPSSIDGEKFSALSPSPPNNGGLNNNISWNSVSSSRPSSSELSEVTFDDYQNFEYFAAISESPISLENEYFNNNRTNTTINNNVNNNSNNSSNNNNQTKGSNNMSNNNNIPEKGFSNNGNIVGNNSSAGANLEKSASLRVHALNVKLKEYEAPKLTEVYGFVGWMLSWLALAVFFLWAFLPEEVWRQFGVTYYPNKYWALAIPAYLLMSYFFLCIVHVGIALMRTPGFSSASLISDEFTREARDFSRLAKSAKSTVGTPEIYDIPLSVTNRLIYSRGGKNDSGYKSTRYRYRFGQSRSARKSQSKHSDLHPTLKQYNINDASNNAPSSIFPTGLQRIRSLPTQ